MLQHRTDPRFEALLALTDTQLRVSRRILRRLGGHDASQTGILRTQAMLDQLEAALGEARHMLRSNVGRRAWHRADGPGPEKHDT